MKKADYSFISLMMFFITTPVFAQGTMITTTPVTTPNLTGDLFPANPVPTISPVTTATPVATPIPNTTINSMFGTVNSTFGTVPAATTNPVFTAGPAVEISITGIGSTVDVATSQTVRQVIGHAVASGVIDRFIVLGNEVGGGFSACAEAPVDQAANFNAVVNQLNAIQPNPQTTAFSVTPIESCTTDSVFCTQDVFQCPNGLFVGRVPPSCNFAACP